MDKGYCYEDLLMYLRERLDVIRRKIEKLQREKSLLTVIGNQLNDDLLKDLGLRKKDEK